MTLTDTQLLRYSRQILLPQITDEGQEKLLNATVLIVGAGGLGNPASLYLAAAGIGHLKIADDDKIDLTNLQRQILFSTDDIDKSKTQISKQKLNALNPEIQITTINERITEQNIATHIKDVDIVIDASDNLTTRFTLNEACIKNKTPLVSGAALGFDGQVCVFDFKQSPSPCYSCLYPNKTETGQTCSEAGVLGPVLGIIASMQALETMKLILGLQSAAGYLMQFDGLNNAWRKLSINPHCTCCA